MAGIHGRIYSPECCKVDFLFSKYMDVKVVETDKGKGLAAAKKFATGDTVTVFGTKSFPATDLTIQNFKHSFHYEKTFIGDHKEHGGLGRYVNDPMPIELRNELLTCETTKAVRAWIIKYSQNMIENKCNVAPKIIEDTLVLIAVSDINPGDPITLTYGIRRWLDETILSTASPRAKLACCLHLIENGYFPSIISDPLFPHLNKGILKGDMKLMDHHARRLQEILGFTDRGLENWVIESMICSDIPVAMAKKVAPYIINPKNITVVKSTNCAQCGKKSSLQCSRCKDTYYCSKACQQTDWPKHKHSCQ